MLGALPLLLVVAVWAQGAESPPVAEPDVLRPPPPLAPTPLTDGLVWELRASPPSRAALHAIAVEPEEARVWIVGDGEGAVFRSPDAGSSWSRVLPPVGPEEEESDEDLLLDAELARDEQREDPTIVVESEDPTADAPDVEADLSEVGASLARAADQSLERVGPSGQEVEASARVWFDPAGEDVVFVGRSDGVWRSADLGQSWTLVVRAVPAGAFLRAGPAIVAAGAGVRVSLDTGETWIQIEGPLASARVSQVVQVGERLFAAASDGLFVSTDTFHWDRVNAPGAGAVSAVVADPDWADGLWMARDDGVFRSDDGGQSFSLAGRQPLEQLSALVHLGEPGHLLAASRLDGVWESMDGGVRWQPVVRLLTEPRVYDLALIGRRPVIATASGVWELVTPRALVDAAPTEAPGFSLGRTVGVALARAGLDLEPASLSQRASLYRLTPKLVLTGAYGTRASRDADYLAEDTLEGHDRALLLTAQICWGACDVLITYSFDDNLEDLVADEIVDADLYVVGGEIYVDDDSTAPIAGAANVAQEISRYRVTLAEQVSDAWLARRRLRADGPLGAGAPLRDQVFRSLQLAELDARLDAFTGGAYTESLRLPETDR